MTVQSVADLLAELNRSRLLEPEQAEELHARLAVLFPEPAALCDELVRRGWLTPYQVEELRAGRGPELVLGQYVLLSRLGEGGMGAVYKARHRRLDRIDAVKVVRPEYLKHPDALQRFHREARAAARLSHPNIVSIYDADEIGGVHFLAMEYVEGADLGKTVSEGGPLTVRQACTFVRQVALGLQHAQERGMVHRDVKPSNLLLTADGATVKILDMGLARLETAGNAYDTPTGLTASGSVMGTPDFMAPEQALDPRSVDIRADIYSLGCTLYFLLTGLPPFPTGSITQKLLWHQQAEPPPLEAKRFDLPLGLPALLRRMIAKHADDRYATPAEAATALEPYARGTAEEGADSTLPGDEGSLTLALPSPVDGGRPATVRSVAATRPSPAFRPKRAGVAAPEEATATETTALEPKTAPVPAREKPPAVALPSRGFPTVAALLAVAGVAAAVAVVLLLSNSFRIVIEDIPPANPQGAKVGLGDEKAAALGALVGRVGELRRLKGHEDAVLSAALSPDGQRAASAGKDRTVRVWDLATGKEVRRQEGHPGPVTSVAWSRTADVILTGGVDNNEGELRLWDLAPGAAAPQRTLATGLPPILCVALSPDGKQALSAGGTKGAKGELRLWNVADGTALRPLKGHADLVWKAAFAEDGQTAASCSFDKTVQLWDLKKGEPLYIFDDFKDRVLCIAFSPDGGRLLIGGESGLLQMRDLKTYKKVGDLAGHKGDVLCAAFTPDGRRVVTGGADATVRVWDATTRELIQSFTGHEKPVTGVDVSRDGQRALSCSEDATVRLWGLPK